MEESVACGATGYTFTAHTTNYQIMKKLSETGTISSKLNLYPLLPNVQESARIANRKGTPELAKEILSRLPALRKKTLIKAGISAMKMDPATLLGAYVEGELSEYINVKPDNAVVRAALLHEAVTDVGLSFRTRDFFQAFMNCVCDINEHVSPGFVTRNFARFVNFFHEESLSLRDVFVMTPFNRIGFQMNPSRQACETSLQSLGKEGEVIAMSILAGGYLSLDEAIQYLNALKNLRGLTVGVSSQPHAQETFTKLRSLLTIN